MFNDNNDNDSILNNRTIVSLFISMLSNDNLNDSRKNKLNLLRNRI